MIREIQIQWDTSTHLLEMTEILKTNQRTEGYKATWPGCCGEHKIVNHLRKVWVS